MLFSLRASRIAISERRMNVCFSATNLSYQKTALGRQALSAKGERSSDDLIAAFEARRFQLSVLS